MKQGKGILTERAKYVADMAALLAERAERYESVVDAQIAEHGTSFAYEGYDVNQADCGTNISRMIVQLRLELAEMGRML